MKTYLLPALLLCGLYSSAQKNYPDSIADYFSHYVTTHEVVPDSMKGNFRFYPADETYRIQADVEEVRNGPWFSVETSGTQRKTFRVYAIAKFRIDGKAVQLSLLQSQGLGAGYEDYLFLPFTDLTNGEDTYTNGRYLDLAISDIKGKKITLDFNKAYNPYCAYVSGKYNCPIPPEKNRLDVAIEAGEKMFRGH
ncbi:MAG: DUF1684 domain-containing protein [Chitinophagaceae bacterium]|nr:MAG: DUF1684 domain-containing protein [Chitinophagaceae bacterium]